MEIFVTKQTKMTRCNSRAIVVKFGWFFNEFDSLKQSQQSTMRSFGYFTRINAYEEVMGVYLTCLKGKKK